MTLRTLTITVVLTCILVGFAVAGALSLLAGPDGPSEEQRAWVRNGAGRHR